MDTPRLDHSTRLMPRDNGTLLCSDTCADVTSSPEQGHHYRPPHHPKPVHPHSTATTPNHCISTAQPPPPKHHILMAQPASQIILSLSAWTPRSHDMATSLSHNVPIDMDTTPLHGTATTTGHRVPMAWLLPQNRHSPKPPCSHGTASSPGYHIPMAWPPPQTTSSLSTRPRTQISASPGHSHHLIQPCPYQHGHHPKVPRSHGAGTRSITPITPHVQHHVSGDNIPSSPQRDPTVIPVPIPCSWATTAPQPSKQSPLAAEGWGRTKLRGSISSCRTPAALCKG